MLYMTLAHATYSGKLSLIQDHYPILRQWAEYLVNETLYPINQAVSDGLISEQGLGRNTDNKRVNAWQSTDDFKGRAANLTSLAVKGVIGLGCMGSIANLAGNTADATRYSVSCSVVEADPTLTTS